MCQLNTNANRKQTFVIFLTVSLESYQIDRYRRLYTKHRTMSYNFNLSVSLIEVKRENARSILDKGKHGFHIPTVILTNKLLIYRGTRVAQ